MLLVLRQDVRDVRDPRIAEHVFRDVVEHPQAARHLQALAELLGVDIDPLDPSAPLEVQRRLARGWVDVVDLEDELPLLDPPQASDLRSLRRERDDVDARRQQPSAPSEGTRHAIVIESIEPRAAHPTPVHARPKSHVLSLVLVSEEDKPLGDVPLRIVLPDTRQVETRSDSDGRIRFDGLSASGTAVVTLAERIRLPPFGASTATVALDGIRIARDREAAFELSTDRNHIVVIERPRVQAVELSGCFEEARSVLVFGPAHSTEGATTSVRAVLRSALVLARGRTLCVAGHTDTKGSGKDNHALAGSRAESVQLYLSGDRDAWAAHAAANAAVADLQAALTWAAATFGITCHPGPIDDDWGELTAQGLEEFRDHVGISQKQPLGADDWAAVFDLYERDLATVLLTDPAGVGAFRDGTLRTDPPWVAYGERWPVEATGVDDNIVPRNRRVDLLVFDEPHLPRFADHDPKGDEVYDGTYVVARRSAPPEIPIDLRIVRSGNLAPLPSGRAWITIGGLGVRQLVADAAGIIRFMTLQGDRISVTAAQDENGVGRAVGHGFVEAEDAGG